MLKEAFMTMGKSNIDKQKYVYRIEKGKEATHVRIGNADRVILMVYKERYNISMTAALHEMIGTAAKCWEERHEFIIGELRQDRAQLEGIAFAYLKKYGRLDKKLVEKPPEQTDQSKK